jgi:hypothetical protein
MNASLHVNVSWDFLTKTRNTVILQPAYLPDLAPAECFLFPQAEIHIERVKVITTEQIKEDLKVILKQAFKHCYEIGRNNGTGYFKGDKCNYLLGDIHNLR